MDLLLGAELLGLPDLLDEGEELGVVEVAEDLAEHVDLVSNVLLGGVQVVSLGLEVSDDLVVETEGLLLENLRLDFQDERRVGLAKSGLAHQGSVGLVIIIVRVGEGLVDVDIVGDAGDELGVAGGGGRLELEVLDGQTLSSLSLVAVGLGHVLVVRVDALDDEVALAVGATNDAADVSVLFCKREKSMSKTR